MIANLSAIIWLRKFIFQASGMLKIDVEMKNPVNNYKAEDQRIYVIPGKNMVVVRMGDASDPYNASFAVSGFDNDLWQKINAVIN